MGPSLASRMWGEVLTFENTSGGALCHVFFILVLIPWFLVGFLIKPLLFIPALFHISLYFRCHLLLI